MIILDVGPEFTYFHTRTIFWVWGMVSIQGDQKSRPPLPGRDEKYPGKMEYSIFKYNLFKYLFGEFRTLESLTQDARAVFPKNGIV